MNEKLITCEELDALLPAYLEGELGDVDNRALERHVSSCTRCSTLLAEVTAIVREAHELPDLAPVHDLWPTIEERIQPSVVSLPAARDGANRGMRRTPRRWAASRLMAAAAALVAATAGITYVATTRLESARPNVAAVAVDDGNTGRDRTALPTPTPVATGRNASSMSAEQLYDQEIARLQTIVRDRRSGLDTATIAVIQRNLGIIDSAIAQSRAALAADPGSRFLNDQLNSVLGQKVELLRTVALLPART